MLMYTYAFALYSCSCYCACSCSCSWGGMDVRGWVDVGLFDLIWIFFPLRGGGFFSFVCLVVCSYVCLFVCLFVGK